VAFFDDRCIIVIDLTNSLFWHNEQYVTAVAELDYAVAYNASLLTFECLA